MLIDKIALHNFRIYQGTNELNFTHNPEKNITVISGNNGYGKTTLLTSLVWCLYGKLMVDVDERFRREVYESGGYKRFCHKMINRWSFSEENPERNKLKTAYSNSFGREAELINHELRDLDTFSVAITISDIFIPSVPCNKIEVKRSYNVKEDKEEIRIYIDGRENELTKEVGPEIFINDFLLPKEVAKFFFFDAEKIVSLAEIRSIEEKRDLSRAYSEVLGIKKYEELKSNLENIRIRLRRDIASENDKIKLKEVNDSIISKEKLIDYYRGQLVEIDEELARKKQDSDKLQEKLIREGSTITLEELADLKTLKENSANDVQEAKSKFKDLLDLAPFAIASKKLLEVKQQVQLEEEHLAQKVSSSFLKQKLEAISSELNSRKAELSLSVTAEIALKQIIESQLLISEDKSFKPLLDLNGDEVNIFKALCDNLFSSYNDRFRALVKSLKIHQSTYAILIKKLSDAETKEKDQIIKEIRKAKTKIDLEITKLEQKKIEFIVKLESSKNDKNALSKVYAELLKKVNTADIDSEKDKIAARLINELTAFINRLKHKKKESLQSRILLELKRLMHKKEFINQVEVIIDGDIIDIEFYDNNGQIINKDGLSKGEQQLYATALLKALVDESNIKFPIFIDSPLQKFDQKHAKNIVQDFYPSVSDQVVLLPLLEKELTEKEYKWLLPRVSRSYLIKNVNKDKSVFCEVESSKLFTTLISEQVHV